MTPDPQGPLAELVREALQELRYEEDVEYTKSKYVAERVGVTSQAVGQAMRALRETGEVEEHAPGTTGVTWRILL